MTRPVQSLTVALAALVVVLSGCASAQTDPQQSASAAGSMEQQTAQNALVACLADAGWSVEVDADGGIFVPGGVPDEQFPTYQAAIETCTVSRQSGVPQLADLSAADWTRLYELESKTAECLRAEGVDVPAIPSEQAFIEQYRSSEPWTSYGFVGSVDEGVWGALNASC